MVRSAVIVDAVRSPIGKGKLGGALSTLHAVELLAQVLRSLVDRSGIEPALVEDVLVGCVSQAADQSACPGRLAWLAAGLPEHVPGVTIDRRCGSSQQALQFAAQGVMAGGYNVVIAAGLEVMSRVPMGSARLGGDVYGPSLTERYAPGLVAQGVSAELIAAKWGIGREAMDAFSARSHQRAAAAADSGAFAREIAPITVPGADGEAVWVTADQTIRSTTTVASLAALRPVFTDDALHARFPEINWSITAGNSSQLADGAAAMLVMDEDTAASLGLRARARFRSFALVGDDPIMMLTGPIPATGKILERSGIALNEIDVFEINEAFASVPLAWLAEFPVDEAKLNPAGGAIALGHPLGASGVRLMTTMLRQLEDTGGRYGLQVMCEGGGMANATIIERL
jgi:acetyl-CoA acetyltransferase family protein